LELPAGVDEKIVLEAVDGNERLSNIARRAKKHIFVKDKMINFVV